MRTQAYARRASGEDKLSVAGYTLLEQLEGRAYLSDCAQMTRTVHRRASRLRSPRDPRPEILRDLGTRVRGFRHDRGITQEDLAETLDLSVAYVSLIERGGRNPPYTTVVAIARALGVATRDLCE
jgi:ribosome-binding protein aMBF1 (putative translation factor)